MIANKRYSTPYDIAPRDIIHTVSLYLQTEANTGHTRIPQNELHHEYWRVASCYIYGRDNTLFLTSYDVRTSRHRGLLHIYTSFGPRGVFPYAWKHSRAFDMPGSAVSHCSGIFTTRKVHVVETAKQNKNTKTFSNPKQQHRDFAQATTYLYTHSIRCYIINT